MRIGCLGDIVFEVSERVIKTIEKISMSGSATYSTHQLHLRSGLTEFVTVPPETISIDIGLSSVLGVDPQAEIEKIRQYMAEGRTLALVIGARSYGRYRWTITSYKAEMDKYAADMSLSNATVSLTLQEYLRS